MKTLFLMRHAKASPAQGNQADIDRTLLVEGRAAAERVGKLLKSERVSIDFAVSSPAARAQETCEIVLRAAGIDLDVRLEQRIYDGGTVSLVEVISETGDRRNALLLVGHNPVLEDLVNVLTGQIVQLAAGSLTEITLEQNSWGEVGGAQGQLKRVIRPADLLA